MCRTMVPQHWSAVTVFSVSASLYVRRGMIIA
jgi:hypothetical protein